MARVFAQLVDILEAEQRERLWSSDSTPRTATTASFSDAPLRYHSPVSFQGVFLCGFGVAACSHGRSA